MRILIVHNFYRSIKPSGENLAVRAESRLLHDHGHDVEEFSRSNDEESEAPLRTRVEAALFMAWNFRSAARLDRTIARFRPNVIHIHNTFPLLSPAVAVTAHRSGVPVVCTLHNYRMFCAAAVLLRDHRSCMECLDRRSALPGLVHGCYENSRLKTFPLALTIDLHRHLGTWHRTVDRFIAISEFQREQLTAAGCPIHKTVVKPNFTTPPPRVLPWTEREDRAIFIGRLTAEKGCEVLLRAWSSLSKEAPLLEIVGEGPERARLQALATALRLGNKVRLLGQLSPEATRERLAGARLLLQPAIWPETFGLTVIEAYAAAVPVVASRIGALPSLVDEGKTGFLSEPGDPESMGSVLRRARSEPWRLEWMGGQARAVYDRLYSPAVNYAQLLQIYREVGAAAAARLDP